jgi:hypothetical protein
MGPAAYFIFLKKSAATSVVIDMFAVMFSIRCFIVVESRSYSWWSFAISIYLTVRSSDPAMEAE